MQGNIIFSHNTDLKLLKTIAASPFQWQMPKPQNIRQLTSLLKRKTQSVRNNYNQIQSSRHWLIYNGVNIGSIYKDIQNAPKQSSSQSSVKDNNPKYHQNLSIHQFSEYFNKAYEQCTFNLRKHVMNTKKQKDRFMYRQIDWMMHLQGSQRYNASWKCIRNMQHKEKYIKIVSQILKKQKRRDNLSQLLMNEFQKTFYNENNNYLWKIISHQLENFSQKFKIDHNLEKMYFKSLILIEQQFKLRLNQQDIERYVKINYFDRVYEQGLKYQTTWAKAWLYMMSGLHNQAISVIQSNHSDYRQFIQAYTESYEAVRNHKPVQAKLSAKIRINDVFYDQMIICLNGQTKFSNKKLFDFDSLQLVWLVMRTTAIFWNTNKQKKQKFIKLRSQMVKKYRNYLSNPNILRYMLYMLDYESIIVMGQSLLNKDDLLHLLIVLQDYPGFFKNINIQKILSQKLTIMIRQMMIQRKQQCIYYIALMPTQAFAIQISKLIVAFYNLDEFNWQQMKELISKSAYQELVESSIYLCAQKSHNYYACGLKLMNLLGQLSHVIKYFIRILIRHHLDEKQFSFQQIQQIQQEGLKLSVLKEPYMKVFQFFSCIRLFKQVFMRQGSMKMQTLVTNNLLVFIDKRQVLNFIQVVQQINECSGIEIYFEFIRDLVYQAQIYFSKINNNQQFKLLKHLISRTCLNILQQQTLKKHRNNIKVQQTMNYLQLNS